MDQGLRRAVPNLLTIARVVLAIGFFAIVSVVLWPKPGMDAAVRQFWGNTAVVVFAIAAITDFADGYFARRWKVVSVFGRVMDPFGDKLLVIGAFVLLASPAFLTISHTESGGLSIAADAADRVTTTTGVRPWMALVILGRELLVTSIRGVLEGMGIDFSAGWSGKWKMVLQSVAAPVALFVAVNPFALESDVWLWLRDVLVWATVLVTAWSAWPYLVRARPVIEGRRAEGDG
jgi:CDP-diacylglycerol--glycerol-3-phosphate 3-phosphatidyltransferase